MKNNDTSRLIAGAKKGGSSRTPVEAPDSLRSIALARVLDLVSEGEILGLANGLESIFLDETPLMNSDGTFNFKNVQVEFRSGSQDQPHIPGFPQVENEIGVNVELKHGTPWVRSINRIELDAVNIRLSVPALSKTNTKNGDINGHTIGYTIQVATDGGAFENALTSRFSGKTTSKYEKSHRIDLPPAEEGWTIRVVRQTPNENSATVADMTFVESITEIIDAKLRYPNSAVIALAIDAEQFQSIPTRAYDLFGRIVRIPSNYDANKRTYKGVWDGTFKLSWTDNPAWIFYDLVTNKRFGLGHLIEQHQVDKWSLYKIGRYCDELVPDGRGGMEPRFTCNAYLQTRADAYKVVSDLASVFRGISFWAAGQITAVADMPQDVAYAYTAANVIDGKFVYQGSPRRQRHTVALVSWNDPNDFGRAKVEYVEDIDGIERYGIQQIEVTAFGCTSRSQANRVGRWILFTERYETDTVTFRVGADGAVAAPGQIIAVADEGRAGRRIGGRISDATIHTITVDRAPIAKVGDRLTVMLPNGTAETRSVLAVNGNAIRVGEDFSILPQRESVWVVESDELAVQKFRVMSVEESGELEFTITAMEYAEGKFAEVEYGIKWEEPNYTSLPPKVQAPPTNITIDLREYAGEIVAGSVVTVSWEKVAGAVKYLVEWRQGDGGWQNAGETTSTSFDIYGVQPGPFEVRITAINSTNGKSNPVRTEPIDIPDTVTKPKVIERIEESIDEQSRRIAAEEIARMQADTAEAEARAAADQAEAEARAAELAQVNENLAAEVESRRSAISAVADDLAAEVSNRETAVGEIANRLLTAEGGLSSAVQEITTLNEAVFSSVDGLATKASASAVSGLDARIEENEREISSTSASITALENTIKHPSTGLDAKASASALQILSNQVHSTTDGLPSKASSSALTALQSRIDDPASGLASKASSEALAALETTVSEIEVAALDMLQLNARLGTIEGSLMQEMITSAKNDAAHTSAINLLESRLNDPDTGLEASAEGLSGLTTRVDTVEGKVSSQATDLTKLQAQVNALDVDTGGAGEAISQLDTRVSQAEGRIESHGDAITALQNSVTSANKTFIQPDQPPTTGRTSGDLWIDTDDNNKLYGFKDGKWELRQDSGKNTIFVQGTQPVARAVNDLWFDTSRNNRQFRWNGTAWVEVSDTRVTANATAITNLTTRVSSIEGVNTTQSQQITTLQNTVDNSTTGVKATSDAVASLTSRVTTAEGKISSNTSEITTLKNTVNNTTTGVKATADALSALEQRVTSTETTNTSQGSAITSLQNTVNNTKTGVVATSNALTALTTRVEATESSISSHNTAITSLQSTVNNSKTGVVATANALSSLTTRVTSAEGKITSHASSISSLTTTVGSHTTTITSHASSINGLQGKAGVTIDSNGYITGWALNNNGKTGSMTVVADKFRIVTPGQTARTPFSLTSSILQLNTDLQMGGGVLWNKGATHSAILGASGASGQFLLWAGKNPTSPTAASKTNAVMYVDKNGAAAFSGTLHSSLLSASAMELNSMRIHSGGGRLCPFTIEDFAYRGLGTGNTSMTLTLSGFKAPNNGSTGFDAKRFAAHKMDVIMEANLNGDRGWETVQFQVQYNNGAWENLASLRTNCNYRGGATLISRYTTKASWSTVNFRCVTSEGNTQTLAFRLSVKNYYESSNTAHSYTGADASGGGSGTAPPSGGGWKPDPDQQIVLP